MIQYFKIVKLYTTLVPETVCPNLFATICLSPSSAKVPWECWCFHHRNIALNYCFIYKTDISGNFMWKYPWRWYCIYTVYMVFLSYCFSFFLVISILDIAFLYFVVALLTASPLPLKCCNLSNSLSECLTLPFATTLTGLGCSIAYGNCKTVNYHKVIFLDYSFPQLNKKNTTYWSIYVDIFR